MHSANLTELSIRDAQKAVDTWIRSTGSGYFNVLTNMAMLAEETGEVARCITRIYGDQIPKPEEHLNLGDELADVIWVTMALANQCHIDLAECFAANLRKKSTRDMSRFAATPHGSEPIKESPDTDTNE